MKFFVKVVLKHCFSEEIFKHKPLSQFIMITIVSGTNRKGSMTFQVAQLCKNLLTQKGEVAQILDLQDLPHDFVFSALYGNKNPEFESILKEYIYSSSKLVLISPEYNGGFSGVLKAFMDGWSPRVLTNQKVALIGVASGRSGNLRGLDYLTNCCHYMKLPVYFDKVPVSRIADLGNTEVGIHDEATIKTLSTMLDGFIKF